MMEEMSINVSCCTDNMLRRHDALHRFYDTPVELRDISVNVESHTFVNSKDIFLSQESCCLL